MEPTKLKELVNETRRIFTLGIYNKIKRAGGEWDLQKTCRTILDNMEKIENEITETDSK